MGNERRQPNGTPVRVPRPTPQFKRRAWLAFQKAIDPLAQPKPLRRQS